MAAADKTGTGFNTPAVVLGTLAAVIFVFALGLFMQGGFLKAQSLLVEERVYNLEDTATADAQAAQQARLEEGPLPIEAAKDQLVSREATAAP